MTFLSISLPQGSGLNGKWRGGNAFCEYVFNVFLAYIQETIVSLDIKH